MLLSLLVLVPLAAAVCLDGGSIDPASLKNLSIPGQQIPLGILHFYWASSKINAHVMKIIAEEVLGYNTFLEQVSGSATAINRLAGCSGGGNCLIELKGDEPEGTSVNDVHLAFETWENYIQDLIGQWESEYPMNAPKSLGSVGVHGLEGSFIRPESLNAGLEMGFALDWYRGFNASGSRWYPNEVSPFFDNIETASSGDRSLLMSCENISKKVTSFQSMMRIYKRHFPDDESIRNVSDGEAWRWEMECYNGTWWLSPACRANPNSCVPYVTHMYWGYNIMQQAAQFHMPIALGSTDDDPSWTSDWKHIVKNNRILTYWWFPDDMFIHEDMLPITYPPYDSLEYAQELMVSALTTAKLEKYSVHNLKTIASDIYTVASQMQIGIADMRPMMKQVGERAEYDLACTWLRNNTDVWYAWLPGELVCTPGQGLVDESGSFVEVAGAAKQCEWCPPGKSSQVINEKMQRACVSCSSGTFQEQPGQTECASCLPGKFASTEGATKCDDCAMSTYAAELASTECTSCPQASQETTAVRAATSEWDCVCDDGFFRSAGHSESTGRRGSCEPCPTGMDCGGAGNDEPVLKEGFWAAAADSSTRQYSVYRCRDGMQCPGGLAGACAYGRKGIGCATCKDNHHKAGGGKCEECGGTSVLPIIVFIIGTFGGLVALAMYARVDVAKVKLNQLALGICATQSFAILQTLSVFNVIKVNWVEPYSTLFDMLSVVSFDLDVLHFSCFLSDSSAISKYVLRLAIFPFCVGVLCCAFGTMKLLKQKIGKNHVINSVGLVTLTLFIMLNLTGLAPFHCISNPNGTRSLASNPAVICYDSSDWQALAPLGVISMLLYGVLFVTWITWVTFRYPAMVASAKGSMVMNRYRFMFQRFTVEGYFFTPIYLARAMCIALVPIAFADEGHRQVILLAFVLLFFGSIFVWYRPWRGQLPNIVDLVANCCLVLMLVCASMLLNVDEDAVMVDMQVFFSIIIVLPFGTIMAIAGYLVFRHFQPPQQFVAFLCHHKVGCAVFARLMKMELEQRQRAPVFLDSDCLDNLDGLLDIVRVQVKNLVVLLTDQTLSRPWCAGEIATAFRNQVNMVPVSFDDYIELTDEDLDEVAIAGRWNQAAFAGCAAQGLTYSLVKEAYAHLRDMGKIPCMRIARCWKGDNSASTDAIKKVAARCQGAVEEDDDTAVNGFQGERTIASSSTSVEMAIIANNSDAEAISTAAVLSRLMRKQIQWSTFELLHSNDLELLHPTPERLVVVLTEGCLTSEGFFRTLWSAFNSWSKMPVLLTVKMERFQYPNADLLRETIVPQASRQLHVEEFKVAMMFETTLAVLSSPFSPSGRIDVLQTEVSAMIDRLNRFDLSRSPSSSSSLWKKSTGRNFATSPASTPNNAKQEVPMLEIATVN